MWASKILDGLAWFTATGFGVGALAWSVSARLLQQHPERKWAVKWTGAGFFGTLVGMVFILAGIPLRGFNGIFFLVGATVFSIWASGRAARRMGQEDPQRIVIDEIVGLWWALAFLPLDWMDPGHRRWVLFAGFALFRIFDVTKLPIRKAQDLPGGLGVVADDVLAGFMANIILQIAVHRWVPLYLP